MSRRLPPGLPARLMRPAFWAAAWVLWFTVLCILSSMSQPGPQIHIVGFDKVQHTVYFAAGGTCLALAMALRRPCSKTGSIAPSSPAPAPHGSQPGAGPAPGLEGGISEAGKRDASLPPGTAEAMTWGKIASVVILTGAAVGWLDEWHQSFTPGRFGLDRYDWLADVLGSALAVPIARRLHRTWFATGERT